MKDAVLAISDVFNVLPDAVIVIDEAGQIVFANALVYGLLGYTPDELDGRDLNILLPGRYRARHTELVASFRKRHGSTPLGYRPVLHVISTDRRNALGKSFSSCFKV